MSTSGYLPEFEQSTVTGLLNPTVAGPIVTPTSGDQSHVDSSPGLRTGVRVVSVGRPADRLDRGTVLIDKGAGEEDHGAPDQTPAPEHALVRGWLRFRYEGFRGTQATAGKRVDESRSASAPHELMNEPLTDLPIGAIPPTAALSANAQESLATVRAMYWNGRTDSAQVSFDDCAGAESLTPPMAVALSMMGRGAAELEFDRIDGVRGPSRHVVSPTQLIARSSRELAA